MHGKDRACCVLVAFALVFVLLDVGPQLSLGTDVDWMNHRPTQGLSEPEEESLVLDGTPHDPVDINGDSDFETTAFAEGWTGNGSSQDPYLIRGLDIDRNGGVGHCISILNTRVHFTISDCNLAGANYTQRAGVYLYNVTNGVLTNNTCTNNYYGIYLFGSDSNMLMNNTCHDNINRGILLWQSDFNTMASNACNKNPCGVCLVFSDSNIIIGNTCTNHTCGIRFYEDCHYNTVVNNTCTDNVNGIYVKISSTNTVANNTSTNNNYGIFLTSASANVVANNTCSDNIWGIRFYTNCTSNTVVNNTFSSNSYGIILDETAENSSIHWNVFANNSAENGVDHGNRNVFSCNYWSDYMGEDADQNGFGDATYLFTGNNDTLPLMYLPTPPIWTELPIDHSREFMLSCFQCDLNATCPAPLTWAVNDTRFDVSSNGMVASSGFLSVGTYWLGVVVTNIYGSRITTSFQVSVADTTPPVWITPPSDQEVESGELVELTVETWDLANISHWNLNDTDQFALYAQFYAGSSTARISNVTPLQPGIYTLNVSAQDSHGNWCSEIFSVTVLESTTTTTTTTTATTTTVSTTTPDTTTITTETSSTTTATSDEIDYLTLFGFVAGLGAVAVILVSVFYVRRSA